MFCFPDLLNKYSSEFMCVQRTQYYNQHGQLLSAQELVFFYTSTINSLLAWHVAVKDVNILTKLLMSCLLSRYSDVALWFINRYLQLIYIWCKKDGRWVKFVILKETKPNISMLSDLLLELGSSKPNTKPTVQSCDLATPYTTPLFSASHLS